MSCVLHFICIVLRKLNRTTLPVIFLWHTLMFKHSLNSHMFRWLDISRKRIVPSNIKWRLVSSYSCTLRCRYRQLTNTWPCFSVAEEDHDHDLLNHPRNRPMRNVRWHVCLKWPSGALGHLSPGTVHWRHLSDIYTGIMLRNCTQPLTPGIACEGTRR